MKSSGGWGGGSDYLHRMRSGLGQCVLPSNKARSGSSEYLHIMRSCQGAVSTVDKVSGCPGSGMPPATDM